MKAIETQNISRFYQKGNIKALDGVSLTTEAGTIFSLLGPNGAGKTTLIKLLLGIVFPTAGNATIFGKPISDISIHNDIGYLAENHRFPEFLTANEILYYYGKLNGLNKAILHQRMPGLFKLVNLEGWENTKIRKFSKGMLQRLGIAQALINEPKMLFLDEPTDGIDPVGRREVRDLLKKLRDQGKTIFLNSHLLSEVERISDEIAILKKGKLVRQGSLESLISRDHHYDLLVESEPSAVTPICEQLSVPVTAQNGHLSIAIKDTAQLNALIDELRSAAVKIRGIIPQKISLEDYFIEVIESKESQ